MVAAQQQATARRSLGLRQEENMIQQIEIEQQAGMRSEISEYATQALAYSP